MSKSRVLTDVRVVIRIVFMVMMMMVMMMVVMMMVVMMSVRLLPPMMLRMTKLCFSQNCECLLWRSRGLCQ